MIKVLIVEDEKKAAHTLSAYIKQYAPGYKVIDVATNVEMAIQYIDTLLPELIFLDVELPDGTAFDILSRVSNQNFNVIFCSGHSHYAIKAIRFSALDYLLKPIDADELIQCLDRIKLTSNERLNTLLLNRQQSEEQQKKLVLSVHNKFHFITINEVIFIESESNYSTFYLQNSKPIVVSKHLKEFEDILPSEFFFRAHKSYLINLHHVKQFDVSEGCQLVMTDSLKVPVSRRRKTELIEQLKVSI